MPSSYPHNLPRLINVLMQRKPESILDVGPGYGKFGFLAREYLDDFERRVRVDAVEVFPDYLERVGWSPYDEVIWGNFLEVPLERRYDLVLMIDVLEHFTKADGYRALYRALSVGKEVLISTPIGYEQGECHGNVHEAHLSEWTVEDFTSHGMTWRDAGTDQLSVIGVAG